MSHIKNYKNNKRIVKLEAQVKELQIAIYQMHKIMKQNNLLNNENN